MPDDQPTSLAELAAGDEPLLLPLLSLDADLLAETQAALARHGLLDPPGDGVLGPVTTWAIRLATGPSFEGALMPEVARRLLDAEPMLPLRPGDDLAGRLVRALGRRGDWVCRVPGTFGIVYVEATEPDGTASPHRPNAFDDTRFLVRMGEGGRPALQGAWLATTRSGETGRDDPVDALGPPRLDPGQYKVWVMGRTAVGTELEQPALVQVAPLPVKRDATKDARRKGGPHQTGMFVIDQHGSKDAPRDRVDDTAVGCLVGQDQGGHEAFLEALRTDPRWRANNGYRFMTSLLTRAEWDAAA